MRLNSLPSSTHPTHRIAEAGAPSTSLVELLAVIIGGQKQIEAAELVLSRFPTLGDLYQAPAGELKNLPGIGAVAAARIKASLELGKRLVKEEPERARGDSPYAIGSLLVVEMSALDREELRVVLLDIKSRVMQISTVYRGCINSTVIRPAEVFQDAVRLCAPRIAIVHNHPSGDLKPSGDDIQVTTTLVTAGKLLDIELLDHVIIGRQRYVSLKERGLGFDG